jgi:hypothetical protein
MNLIPRKKYVAINMIKFEVFLCATKESLSTLTKKHVNTIGCPKEKKIIGEWMIIPVVEQ